MKARHARLPLDLPQRLLDAAVSPAATLTYLRIRLHQAKRSIPGLLSFGEAGLAESLQLDLAPTRRHLRELQPFVLFDRERRLMYATGAIEEDPPASKNAVIAFARQFGELPTSSVVTVEVERAIVAALDGTDLLKTWHEQRQVTRQTASLALSQNGRHQLLRDPVPRSDAAAATADSVTAARFARAWARLPRPFAAAASEEINRAAQTIDSEEFDRLVRALAVSKWVSGEGGLNVTPTLRALIDRPEYRERISAGEFRSAKLSWSCPECRSKHEPGDECPAPCRGCGEHHPSSQFCLKLRRLEDEERRLAEKAATA